MFSPRCHVSWVFFARLAWTLGHIWRRAIYKNTLQYSSWWESSHECHQRLWLHTPVNMPRIINLDACKIPRTFAGISFRILAIRQVMTRLWHWPGPRPPSPWWLQGMAQTHDVLTHEILTVFTHPRLAKHGSYWELWLASCLMTIVMAAICDWSVTSHTGLWLADNVPMYHCTSHYPCLSLSWTRWLHS